MKKITKLLFIVGLSMLFFTAHATVGTGIKATHGYGKYRESIYWLNWNRNAGEFVQEGDKSTFYTSGGKKYEVFITKIELLDARPKHKPKKHKLKYDYSEASRTSKFAGGANFPYAYNFDDENGNPNFTKNTVISLSVNKSVWKFRLTVKAWEPNTEYDPNDPTSKKWIPIKADVVIAGTESLSDIYEHYSLTAPLTTVDGEPTIINTIETYLSATQPFNWSDPLPRPGPFRGEPTDWSRFWCNIKVENTNMRINGTPNIPARKIEVRNGWQGSDGKDFRGDVMFLAHNVKKIDVELGGHGVQSIAIGIMDLVDAGDVPDGYEDKNNPALHSIIPKLNAETLAPGNYYFRGANAKTHFTDESGAPVVKIPHLEKPELRIGGRTDYEKKPTYSADAKGDDNTDKDDEDGVENLILGCNGVINVVNEFNKTVYLHYWIDKNKNGQFDYTPYQPNIPEKEYGRIEIPANYYDPTTQNSAVRDPKPIVFPIGQLFNATKTETRLMRFRITTDKDILHDHTVYDGEVEDAFVTFLVPKSNPTNPQIDCGATLANFSIDDLPTTGYTITRYKDVNGSWVADGSALTKPKPSPNTLPFSLPKGKYKFTVSSILEITTPACQKDILVEVTKKGNCKNYWYGTESNVWDVPNNWTKNYVPKTYEDVEFATAANNGGTQVTDPNKPGTAIRDLHVPVGLANKKEIGKLINESTVNLVVPADATIIVHDTVIGSGTLDDVDKIQVLAKKNKPNGTIIFKGQPCDIPLYGTVQLYAKGYKGAEQVWVDDIPGSPTLGRKFKSSYHWQHFGVPVESIAADDAFYGSFLREYDETFNGDTPNRYYQKWHTLNNSSVLKAWKGYEITQEQPTTYVLKGKFQFCDKTITLTRKAVAVQGSTDPNIANKHYGLGQNVFGNSYTASIDIDKMTFPTEVEKVVYLYNTGRFQDWTDYTPNDQENDGVQVAGQYTAIPKNVASIIYDGRIPSMNGFLLRFTKNETIPNKPDATVNVKYADGGVKPNLRPQTVAKRELSYLDIVLRSKSTFDKVMLVSEQGTSENFDNGWDGYKFFGTPTAFIYTETGDGPMQINTSESLHNKVITFYANKDKDYTLHLIKHHLSAYKDLALLDLENRTTVPLVADTTVYRFSAKNLKKMSRRFKIVNSKNVQTGGLNEFTLLDISYQNNKIVSNNYTKRNGTIEVFDVAGRLVMSKLLNVGTTSYPVNLSQGSYIVRVIADGRQSKLKIIVK